MNQTTGDKMSSQEPTLFWFTGVLDDSGLDYFEPASAENAYKSFLRSRSNQHRHAKAFIVGLTEETEKSVMEQIKFGNYIMAKLIIESVEKISYER